MAFWNLLPLRIPQAGMIVCTLLACLTADAATPSVPAKGEPVRIGVLAYRGVDRAYADWQPHADYLQQRLAPLRFAIVPLTLAEFRPAIAASRIDLIITNTGHYVAL